MPTLLNLLTLLLLYLIYLLYLLAYPFGNDMFSHSGFPKEKKRKRPSYRASYRSSLGESSESRDTRCRRWLLVCSLFVACRLVFVAGWLVVGGLFPLARRSKEVGGFGKPANTCV